jgi:hypothetical protein
MECYGFRFSRPIDSLCDPSTREVYKWTLYLSASLWARRPREGSSLRAHARAELV